jgi:hypothetical protein
VTPLAARGAVPTVAAIVLAACGGIPGIGGPQPVVPRGGAGGVAGFVRDETGRPMAGAFVAASCQVRQVQIVADAQGWYDLGTAGLAPGRCSIKGGTDDGRWFFGEVMVVGGTTQRIDFTAKR